VSGSAPPTQKLAGRVALVTGASRGIGRAVALDLAAHGATVAVAGRTLPGAIETANLIASTGASAAAFAADLRDPDELATLVDHVVGRFEQIDILVNNAAITRAAGLAEETADGFADVIALDLTAPFLLVNRSLPQLSASPNAAVVNIGSVLGLVAFRGATAYSAAKGGLHQMTRAMAVDLASVGVRVNAVAPGYIKTDMFDESHPPGRKLRIAALHALGRVGAPEEVASAVSFLASDDASFITGVCLPVDGGLTAQFGFEAGR
jgi:3-oxoacyl-[acyl-carrier protein] reductase